MRKNCMIKQMRGLNNMATLPPIFPNLLHVYETFLPKDKLEAFKKELAPLLETDADYSDVHRIVAKRRNTIDFSDTSFDDCLIWFSEQLIIEMKKVNGAL